MLVSIILTVFFAVCCHWVAELARMPFDRVAIYGLAYLVFRLAVTMAKKEGGTE